MSRYELAVKICARLEEAGLAGPSYAMLKRRLPVYAEEGRRRKISVACAADAGLGLASLVLYDVSTEPAGGPHLLSAALWPRSARSPRQPCARRMRRQRPGHVHRTRLERLRQHH